MNTDRLARAVRAAAVACCSATAREGVENLLKIVWGYEYAGEYRSVDVHIRRLRV